MTRYEILHKLLYSSLTDIVYKYDYYFTNTIVSTITVPPFLSLRLLSKDKLVLGGYDGGINLIDLKTQKINTFNKEHSNRIVTICIVGRRRFATATFCQIKLWDINFKESIGTLDINVCNKCFIGSFSPDSLVFCIYSTPDIYPWDF